MNREELRRILNAENISLTTYSLDGKYCEECLRLEKVVDGWVVSYSERGLRTNERHFDSEEDACRYMSDRLLRGPTTRNEDS